MKKALSIPAAKWRKAKTDEEREALREEYTVDMTAEEIAAHEELQESAAREHEQAAQKQKKKAALDALADIDRRAARHVRALLLDKTDAEAVRRLAALEEEAAPLRDALKAADGTSGAVTKEGEI